MRNFGVLISSHGNLAKESLKVVEMIAGKQNNTLTLGLEEGMGIKEFKEQFDQKLNELQKTSDFCIVFADIYGGTPFNTITRSVLEGKDIIAYSGYSLPVLLELLTNENLSKQTAIELIEQTHLSSLSRIDKLANSEVITEIDL